MIQVGQETWEALDRRLQQAGVAEQERPAWRRWIHYYLDFCHKYAHAPRAAVSMTPFLEKLESKGQSADQREQASRAVRLLIARSAVSCCCEPSARRGFGSVAAEAAAEARGDERLDWNAPDVGASPGSRRERKNGQAGSWEEGYDQLEAAVKMRHYSPKTLQAYRIWVRKLQAFVRNKPTGVLDTSDVKAFLTDLAVKRDVAASTQNQAFNALLFFYRHVLGREFGRLDGVVRAKRRPYVPVVLSRSEVEAVLGALSAPYRLVATLLYGCGLRLSECLMLRVHCFNPDTMILTVHDGKGQRDRTVPLPERLLPDIQSQMDAVAVQHRSDLQAGCAGVFLPGQLEKKYRNAAREYIWQWFFPAINRTAIPGTGETRRYHLQDSHVQSAVKRAAQTAAIRKRVTPHTFRHTYASHLLLAGYDVHTIQRLLGHSDVKTTMIYLQTVPGTTLKQARSPLDLDHA